MINCRKYVFIQLYNTQWQLKKICALREVAKQRLLNKHIQTHYNSPLSPFVSVSLGLLPRLLSGSPHAPHTQCSRPF